MLGCIKVVQLNSLVNPFGQSLCTHFPGILGLLKLLKICHGLRGKTNKNKKQPQCESGKQMREIEDGVGQTNLVQQQNVSLRLHIQHTPTQIPVNRSQKLRNTCTETCAEHKSIILNVVHKIIKQMEMLSYFNQ